MESIETLDSIQLSRYLRNEHDDKIASLFLRHKISGNEFMNMSEADLRYLLPCIGDLIRIRKLQSNHKIRSHRGRDTRGDTQHSRHVMVSYGHGKSDVGPCRMKPNAKSSTRSNASSTGISQLLEGVQQKLVLVQKERNNMKELAKKEALLQGRKTAGLDWYDYSGCKNKYV